jgi:aspartokinase
VPTAPRLLAASKMRGVPPQMLEFVAGLGEVWSAQTLSAYLKTTGQPGTDVAGPRVVSEGILCP